MSAEPVRHLFTVDDYHQMDKAGVFAPDQQFELIAGEVIEMTPIGSRHAGVVNRLNQLLVPALIGRAVVAVQNPVRIDDLSEPQPDITLLRPRLDFYRNRHPTAEDVLLLIEVADTTASWDRDVKRSLYATAGIGEMWIVDLATKVVEVATEPAPEGYRSISLAGPGTTIRPTAFPDLLLATADLLS